ncbi:MAG: hypothetical protein ACOZNI_31550 [Myxococcota bacterium]
MTPEHDMVPEVLAPGDPRSGDAALRRPGSHRDFTRAGGIATPEELDAAEVAFHALYLAVLAGDRPFDDPELARLAAWLRVDGPIHHDTREPRVAEVVVGDDVLADVAEDLVPEIGVVCERVTGDDRPPGVVAGAVLCFVEMYEDGQRPFDWWFGEEPDRPLARSATVVSEAPPCVWADGAPIVPLAARRVPPDVPAGAFVGRAYRVGEGWAWSAVLPLPRAPSPGPLVRRLTLELWRHRLGDRRASWEDALRASPDLVYRAACEGAR